MVLAEAIITDTYMGDYHFVNWKGVDRGHILTWNKNYNIGYSVLYYLFVWIT